VGDAVVGIEGSVGQQARDERSPIIVSGDEKFAAGKSSCGDGLLGGIGLSSRLKQDHAVAAKVRVRRSFGSDAHDRRVLPAGRTQPQRAAVR
jgi:hypothetical protein